MSIQTDYFDLTERVALVTGGATGIGYAIANGLALHGAKVAIASRQTDAVSNAINTLNEAVVAKSGQSEAIGVELDVRKDESVEAAVSKVVDRFGRLDILVNSAGYQLRKPLEDLTSDEVNAMYDTHVTGSFRCSQVAGRVFMQQGGGCIINIASIGSFMDMVEVGAYSSAKSALLGLTRNFANEWAKHGIRTNAIAPGYIPTEMTKKSLTKSDRGRRILENIPIQRYGRTDEIAGAAVFLASPAASYVNGHTLVVDGGYLICGIGHSVAPWSAESDT